MVTFNPLAREELIGFLQSTPIGRCLRISFLPLPTSRGSFPKGGGRNRLEPRTLVGGALRAQANAIGVLSTRFRILEQWLIDIWIEIVLVDISNMIDIIHPHTDRPPHPSSSRLHHAIQHYSLLEGMAWLR